MSEILTRQGNALQVFALLPPSKENLGAYVSWAWAARQAGVYLPEHAQGCVRVEVPAGSTFFIPGAPGAIELILACCCQTAKFFIAARIGVAGSRVLDSLFCVPSVM